MAAKAETRAVKTSMICFACWNDKDMSISLPRSPRIEDYGGDLIHKPARMPAIMTQGAL